MPYRLTLSPFESCSLDFCAARGYFPEDLGRHISAEVCRLADEAGPADKYRDERQFTVEIPEHLAWGLNDLREEDPDAYLACLGGSLRDRVLALESEVV